MMPIDPRRFAMTPEGRTADRLADLERETRLVQRSSLNRVVAIARVSNATLTGISNTVATTLTFTDVEIDTGGSWNPVLPDRLVAPVPGAYMVAASVDFDVNATGDRAVTIKGSAFPPIAFQGRAPTTGFVASPAGVVLLDAGDEVQLEVWQNSGGTLNVETWNLSLAFLGVG